MEEKTPCENFPRRGHACLLNFLFVASTDPLSMGPQKALETIGANLQKQYENWQPRVSLLHLPFLSQSWVLWFEPEKMLASSQIIQYVCACSWRPSLPLSRVTISLSSSQWSLSAASSALFIWCNFPGQTYKRKGVHYVLLSQGFDFAQNNQELLFNCISCKQNS